MFITESTIFWYQNTAQRWNHKYFWELQIKWICILQLIRYYSYILADLVFMVTIHYPTESWTTDLVLLQGNSKSATELIQRVDTLVIQILCLCLVATETFLHERLSSLLQVNVRMRLQFYVLNIFRYLNKKHPYIPAFSLQINVSCLN